MDGAYGMRDIHHKEKIIWEADGLNRTLIELLVNYIGKKAKISPGLGGIGCGSQTRVCIHLLLHVFLY